MKKNLKLFFLFSKFSLKNTFQTSLGAAFFLMGKIIRFAFFFFLIYLIFSKTQLVRGYSLPQAIIFYLTFNLVDTVSQIMFREVYRFRYQVISGSFDLTLTKPIHPFIKILIGGVDFLDLILLIPYIILLIVFISHIPVITAKSIAGYFLLLIGSFMIATAFHIIVLALGILTTQVDHTIMIYRDLTSLGRFPMAIYHEPIRSIFTFILPVGIMMSFPTEALFNLLRPLYFLLAFLISFCLLFISLRLWNFALKKYQSYGG